MKTLNKSLPFIVFTICISVFYNKAYSICKISNLNSHLTYIVFDDGKKITIEEKLKKYQGTFQIQVKNMRMKPNIPYNIDELIEKNRKQNETVYISLGTNVRLKILSLNEIKNNSLQKLDLISVFQD